MGLKRGNAINREYVVLILVTGSMLLGFICYELQ